MTATLTMNSTPASEISLPILTKSQSRTSTRTMPDPKTSAPSSIRAPSLRENPASTSATRNVSELDISTVNVHSVPSHDNQDVKAPFDGIEESSSPELSLPVANGYRRSKEMMRREQAYFIACCLPLFLAGWNDATAGPLLPRMQEYYHIDYVVVSMIFVCNCVGFVSAAIFNMWFGDRLGFGVTITAGAALQGVAYCIQAARPPFAVMAITYTINGFGEALQDAQSNGLVATLPTNANARMSLLHGIYGLGAFASPLVATQFSKMSHWNFHYLTSLGVAMATVVTLVWVFRFRNHADLLREIGVQPSEAQTDESSKIKEIMSYKLVHLLAFFILVYVGAEVTIGGWIVTFVLRKRGAGHNAGYVSSGFFGGLTLGRMCLFPLNRKVGEQKILYFYTVLSIALELTIWFIPSLYENAIAVSLVGVCLGPIYPIVMNVCTVIIPRRLLTGSIGWIASIGQTGSAAFPFVLGVMAEKKGVQTLQPLLVAMLGFLLAVWFFVPSSSRHMD